VQTITVTIIGGGPAGLAMSNCLSEHSINHVVLERSEVANSWRTERWDSLRLLTPNWLTRLPGYTYGGHDPDGYMTAPEVVDFLDSYSRDTAVPVQTNTTVLAVASSDAGYVVTTDHGQISSRAVVVATGACSTPKIPAMASELPRQIRQLAPIHYRRPSEIDDGKVLVVGASASGVQLADELARNGRDVTLAVGAHTRLPRMYRGRDIHWWMDTIGLLDIPYDEVGDIAKARRLPSLQLVGSPERRSLDLNALTNAGVDLVGRLVGVDAGRAQFSGSLANVCADADLKMGRLLDQIDKFADDHALDTDHVNVERLAPTCVPTPRTTEMLSEYSTVIWATGFKPSYPFLDQALLDLKGGIVHDGGVMEQPGMYVLGLPFTRSRKSSFLDGVGPDSRFLTSHLMAHLNGNAAHPTTCNVRGTRLAREQFDQTATGLPSGSERRRPEWWPVMTGHSALVKST
jgi:putative flavoprotein involved in K+ transport